jgi:hypothetical protein
MNDKKQIDSIKNRYWQMKKFKLFVENLIIIEKFDK